MLRFIFADLRHFRLGALVVVVLIALSVALGTAVTLQERALRLGSARASEKFDLVVGAPGSETQLVLSTVFLQTAALPLMPGDVLTSLTEDPRVAWAAPVGFGDSHAGYPIVGTTTALVNGTSQGFLTGRVFAAEGEAVAGAAVNLAEGETITPTHGQLGQGGHSHGGISYRIVGKLQPTGTPWDRAILVPIQAVWHVHDLEAGHAHEEEGHADSDGAEHDHDHRHAAAKEAAHEDHGSAGKAHEDHDADHEDVLFDPDAPLAEDWHGRDLPGLPAILVKPVSFADAYKLRQSYRERPDTVAVFPGEVLTGLYAMLGDARQVLAAVVTGTQALIAAALLLVAVIHVGQRRRQIGALRAFGAPRGAIFSIVWGELFALFAIGIAVGLALGYLAAVLMSRAFAMRQGFALPVEFAPEDLVGLAILLVAAALIPLLPALLAWRQPLVSSLRG